MITFKKNDTVYQIIKFLYFYFYILNSKFCFLKQIFATFIMSKLVFWINYNLKNMAVFNFIFKFKKIWLILFLIVLRFSASCKRPKRSSNFTIESWNIWNLTKRQRLFGAQRPIIHHSTKIQTSSRWENYARQWL